MIKYIIFLISLNLHFSGISQDRCYHCFEFQEDSVSVDSTLEVSYFLFPRATDLSQFNSLPDGLWASVSEITSKIEFIFEVKNGKINGRVIQFPLGEKQSNMNEVSHFEEYTFVNGKANGKFVKWWDYSEKKKQSEGYFSDNLRDSVWLNYYAKVANYSLFTEERYKKGKLHGIQKEFHSNGKLASIKTCVDDNYVGESTDYHTNGQKHREIYYLGGYSPFASNYKYINTYDQNGVPQVVNGNGTHKILNRAGNVWKAGPVVDGYRHGVWTKYPNGTFESIEIYEKGVLVE